jgi:hypothetical protein
MLTPSYLNSFSTVRLQYIAKSILREGWMGDLLEFGNGRRERLRLLEQIENLKYLISKVSSPEMQASYRFQLLEYEERLASLEKRIRLREKSS